MFAPTKWPVDEPKRGKVIATVGWPGKFRAEEKGEIEFAAFPMIGQPIDAVESTWFTIPFDREAWIASDFDPTNPVSARQHWAGWAVRRSLLYIEVRYSIWSWSASYTRTARA